MKQASLFSSKTPAKAFEVVANIDGGARGNPGPAAYGVVIRNPKGEILEELAEYLGIQTNNYAEYSGLVAVLEYAVNHRIASLKILSDSELLVRQMRGQYKVSNPVLREFYQKAQTLIRKMEHVSIEHVMREKNKEADRLVNQVLDSRK